MIYVRDPTNFAHLLYCAALPHSSLKDVASTSHASHASFNLTRPAGRVQGEDEEGEGGGSAWEQVES